MKKIAIASFIALAATAASALEIGLATTADYSGATKRSGYGVTVGQSYGKVSATASVERFTKEDNDQTRVSVVGGYDVAKVGPITFTPKVGVSYLNNQVGQNGYAMTVGVGAALPVTSNVSLGVDMVRQYGQERVSHFDGNRVTVGAKYRF